MQNTTTAKKVRFQLRFSNAWFLYLPNAPQTPRTLPTAAGRCALAYYIPVRLCIVEKTSGANIFPHLVEKIMCKYFTFFFVENSNFQKSRKSEILKIFENSRFSKIPLIKFLR